jgi:hypothetical protein
MALVPPVQKDGFSYAGDSFYCEASNLNRHRRATLPELKNHFNGKDTENHPAHWYEAQLLHYGLPPSKVKGTAHKRLFDAVMGSGLVVPSHIQKIETDLKKEWTKKEREAKKMLKESATTKPPAKGTKRKADQVSTSTSTSVNVNVSVSVSSTGVVEVQAAQRAAKKAKAAPKTTAKEKKAAPAAKPIAPTAVLKENKQTARKSTATSKIAKVAKTTAAKPKAAAAVPKEKKTTAPKTTVKEKKPAPAKSTTAAAKPAKPAAKLKGAAGKAAQRLAHSQGEEDDAPPPYSEYDPGVSSGWRESAPPISPTSPRRRIGLLNGRYNVFCEHAEGNFPEYQDRLNLIATLDGNALWLNFNLGVATGMMRVQRPYEVNTDHAMTVLWRGNGLSRRTDQRELFNIDTDSRAGLSNGLFFMGDGHIRGFIRYGSERDDDEVDLEFDAYRQPNQSMTSEISPTEAREIWASLETRRGSYYPDSDSYDDH